MYICVCVHTHIITMNFGSYSNIHDIHTSKYSIQFLEHFFPKLSFPISINQNTINDHGSIFIKQGSLVVWKSSMAFLIVDILTYRYVSSG